MPRTIILDTFPVSCIGRNQRDPLLLTTQCRTWVAQCALAGNTVIVPAISYYEALRELERLNAQGQIRRLRQFCQAVPNRFLLLETAHIESAARMWAQIRNEGLTTASLAALDGDVILAAQSLSLELPKSEFVVATTNVAHLSRFVPAEEWADIAPGS